MDISGQYLMKALHTQEAMDHPAEDGKKGMSASVTLRQRLQILHDNPRPALLRVVKRQAVLQVRAGRPQLPQPEQGAPQRQRGGQTEGGLRVALRQTKTLLGQLVGRLEVSPQ
jgi:hypothetical protein